MILTALVILLYLITLAVWLLPPAIRTIRHYLRSLSPLDTSIIIAIVIAATLYGGGKGPPGPDPNDPLPPAWILRLWYDPATGNLHPTAPIKLIFPKKDTP